MHTGFSRVALRGIVLAVPAILSLVAVVACGAPPVSTPSEAPVTPQPVARGDARRGQALFQGQVAIDGFVACTTCHSVGGEAAGGIGPNLAGVAARAGERAAGMAPEAYVRRSFLVHDEYVVPGYQPGLVAAVAGREFADVLSASQADDLVAYLLTLEAAPVVAAAPIGSTAPTASATAPPPSTAPTASATGRPTSPEPTATALATRPIPTATPGMLAATAAPASALPAASPTSAGRASATPAPQPSATAVPTVPAPPTATPAPTAVPAPAPTRAPVQPPAATATPLGAELVPDPGLAVLQGCMTCHDAHQPQVVSMPHVAFPTCNTCHAGAPIQVACSTCHSQHGVFTEFANHPDDPNTPCTACHTQ